MSGECAHPEFDVQAIVNRFEDTGTFNLELRVSCMECGARFEFAGVEPGLSSYEPRASFGNDEIRLPIVPPGAAVPPGLPGFEIRGPVIDGEIAN